MNWLWGSMATGLWEEVKVKKLCFVLHVLGRPNNLPCLETTPLSPRGMPQGCPIVGLRLHKATHPTRDGEDGLGLAHLNPLSIMSAL